MILPMKFNSSSYRKLFGLTLAGLLVSVSPLAADDRDDRIEDTFKHSHVYRSQLDKTDISVKAKNGVAVLTGTVDNEDQRRLAEDTVRGIAGVDRIDNRVRVTNEPKESTDDWIALKVRSALLFHRNVSVTDTNVVVREGVVTLKGTAASDAEKALAAEYANDVKGVTRVDNQIQVIDEAEAARRKVEKERMVAERDMKKREADMKNREGDLKNRDRMRDTTTAGDVIDDASITAQIKSSLAVRKSTSAIRTNVTTRDGIVTVTGTAKNGAEKDLVTKLAENIDGVRTVHNDMSVKP